MTSKGYFNKVKKSGADIGDIVYWNNQSHVALVTKREETIKKDKNGKKKKKVFIYFSQHSNETLPFFFIVISCTYPM